ncbi:MAG: putative lipoprotein, partial [Acidobacteria bacterium]|nr:putative lipoprotein [Acidobacteriota bacterium]
MRRRPALALAALLAAGCSVGGGVPGGSTGTVTTAITTTTTTAPPPALCLAPTLLPAPVADETEVGRVPGANPVAAAIGFSAAVYECAADVVIVSTGDLGRVALAARLAAALEGPLLFGRAAAAPALEAELARLVPQRVWQVGDDVEPGALPEGTEVELLCGDPWRLAEEVSRQVGGGPALVLPETGGPEAVAVTVQAMAEGSPLGPPPATTSTTAAVSTTGVTTTSVPPGDGSGPAEGPVPVVLIGTGERGVAWLVEAGEPELALAAAAAAWSSGGLMALVDGADLRALPEVGRALQAAPGGMARVHLVGEVTDDASWQLPLLLEGEELPGGGYLLFPGRRLVALYGHAWAPELGVLGEQTPPESVERVRPIAAQYAAEGVVIVPAFEIIATVADARAGDDGDYSNESSLDDLRPLIETAGEEGLYVLLDLQPGRSDFLSQARLYEEFLRLPYVGLALDPEWRLGPDELHLQQYGSVSA